MGRSLTRVLCPDRTGPGSAQFRTAAWPAG